VQQNGISADELETIESEMALGLLRDRSKAVAADTCRKYGLMHLLACFTLFDNEPQLVNTILDGFLAVTRERNSGRSEEISAKRKGAPSFSACL